ncbi:hypothetical protein BU15DRAFT_68693 [Melanogaster broomeanus]|nr:hypothetical protein BU15DRAFT_68693 [Melanogaster broomeanus]
MFQLREINLMDREMCQYLEWEVNVAPATLKEFEVMIGRDFIGPGPYPTHILPTAAKATPPPIAMWAAVSVSAYPSPPGPSSTYMTPPTTPDTHLPPTRHQRRLDQHVFSNSDCHDYYKGFLANAGVDLAKDNLTDESRAKVLEILDEFSTEWPTILRLAKSYNHLVSLNPVQLACANHPPRTVDGVVKKS